MKEYKLDKTAFKIQTFEEADMDNFFDNNINFQERMSLAFDLVCSIYGIHQDSELKDDGTIFTARKFESNA